jgi:hypothetical protein
LKNKEKTLDYIGREIMENILVGLLAVVTVGAGFWSWWMEHGKSSEANPDKED